MNILKKFLPYIIIICFSYLTVRHLFIPGFFPIHDDTQVQRVFEMKKSLSDGMFPVRWVQDLGYGFGYPIFNFYAPLAYYIGGSLNLLGFDALTATKIMLGFSVILSAIAMYLLAKEFWGRIGGIVSAALYLFAPYHALNIYVRGDFSEVLAYAFIPLIFLGIYKISLRPKNWLWIIITSFSYAAIILSHNLTALMVTPFIVVYALVLIITLSKNNYILHTTYYILPLLLGLLLSAFYWIPALYEMNYTNVLSQIGGGADYKDHFVCPAQLWESQWGFGGSTRGCMDGLSFRIGKLYILLTALSLVILLYIWTKQKRTTKTPLFFITSFLASIFLMLEISKPVWQATPQMAYFQYPWRFLALTSFTVSFLSGSVFIIPRSKFISVLFGTLIIAVILFSNLKLFTPQFIKNVKSEDFTNDLNLKWRTSKISDEYMPGNFTKPNNMNEIPASKFTVVDKETKIEILEDKVQNFSAKITSSQNNSIIINQAYFPAWHIYLDKSEIPFKIFNKGLEIKVPKGEHIIDVKFIETPIEKFSDLLTFAGVVALFIVIITQYVKKAT